MENAHPVGVDTSRPQRCRFDSSALSGISKNFLSPVGGGNLSPRNVAASIAPH